jgi:transposase
MDESGFSVDAPRPSGYSDIGKRCYGTCDWHKKGRINAIGALMNGDLFSVRLFECSIDSDVFYSWLTQALIDELPPHSVLVLDNATFHKRKDATEALLEAGHSVLFLPPYSPDLNPIEHIWAQLKAIRRKKRCDVDTLFREFD